MKSGNKGRGVAEAKGSAVRATHTLYRRVHTAQHSAAQRSTDTRAATTPVLVVVVVVVARGNERDRHTTQRADQVIKTRKERIKEEKRG